MAKSKDYWKKRFEKLEDDTYRKSQAYYQDLQKQFRRTSNEIEMQISSWYYRLADNNEISYSLAKKSLNRKELKEFRWTVEQYIEYGKDNALNQKWMKELENASIRVHISRLEAMKLQMQQQIERLFVEYEGGVSDFLNKTFQSTYYNTAYEIYKGTGVGVNLHELNHDLVQNFLRKPWAQDGKDFSSRIWQNKEQLIQTLHTELSQNLVRGLNPGKSIEAIAKRMDVSKSKAGNLVMTETAAIHSMAQQQCYKDLDIEEFEIVATLDTKTSDHCRHMDGKHFPMNDYKVNVTAPPFHCRCRTCTCPYFDDEFTVDDERAYRDVDGTTKFEKNMSYHEWYEKYVASKPKAMLNEKKSKNRYADEKQFKMYRDVLGEAAPKTLEDFQNLKYNSNKWEDIKREYKTINSIIHKTWDDAFKKKAKDTYYDFKMINIEMSDHALARYLDRSKQSFTFTDIVEQHAKAINFTQLDGRQIRFYDGRALIYSSETGEIVSIVCRNNISKEWSVFNE